MATVEATKRCSKCRQVLPLACFAVRRNRNNRPASACRACHNAATSDWQKANAEKCRTKDRRWYAANRQHVRARKRAWRETHKEEINAEKRAKRAADPEYAARHCQYIKDWQAKNKDKVRTMTRRRHVKKKGLPSEDYDSLEIFERDGWRCGICDKRVFKQLCWPHPQSASVDHIVPLSKGGPDTRENVQCTHMICNLRKSAYRPGQLRLWG